MKTIVDGALRGGILECLLFIVSINDLVDVDSNVKYIMRAVFLQCHSSLYVVKPSRCG